MTTVFLSGSRSMSRLNDAIRDRIQNMIDKKLNIIVGDANGADKAMQRFLADCDYENVVVYCSGEKCRNNLGGWTTHNVPVSGSLSGRDFYVAKDKAMASVADFAFVLWDGKSSGSIGNALELLKDDKKVVLYISAKRHFSSLHGVDGLISLLKQCDPGTQREIEKKTRLKDFIEEANASRQNSLAF